MNLLYITLTSFILAQSGVISSASGVLTCGANQQCPTGFCCSSAGKCGKSSSHCDSGCQSAFGSCAKQTGECGGSIGITCSTGCCSQYGFCGSAQDKDYCSIGCQTAFGYCWDQTPMPNPVGPSPQDLTTVVPQVTTSITTSYTEPTIVNAPHTPINVVAPQPESNKPTSLPSAPPPAIVEVPVVEAPKPAPVELAPVAVAPKPDPIVVAPPPIITRLPPVIFEQPGQTAHLTYYTFGPTGLGFCDEKNHADDDMVVAVSTGLMNGHSNCMRTIEISYNGKTARATIVDQCSEAGGCRPNNIDGTPGVWAALGLSLDLGVVSAVQWKFV